jgi:GTP pyrophosphokinase
VATAADVRVLIVKLADRYHNMSTLDHVPPEKQKRIALETLEIYAPLADRLGMGRIRRDFEDMAFPFIDADAYQHALELRKLATKETETGLVKVRKEVRHALARKGIHDFETGIRMKGLWSLHQKLKRKGDDITRIHDIAALRIIVPTVSDAYTALGALHALWKPLPGGFKDYIAVPKPSSGYQSLHTTVVTPEAGIVEIQVRTREMHEQAEHGIASHGSYKAVGKGAKQAAVQKLSLPWIRDLIPNLLQLRKGSDPTIPKPITSRTNTPQWLSDLADAHASVGESSEFVEGLKSDFFSHRIFVFSPRGDVVDLPTASTPVDFAYAIHSDLGEHMQGAKVNNKLVSFDTELKNGDMVEIIKSKNARPTAKWHDYARTSLARRNIRSFLENNARTDSSLVEIKPLRMTRKKTPKGTKPSKP